MKSLFIAAALLLSTSAFASGNSVCREGAQEASTERTMNGDQDQRIILTCVHGKWINTYENKVEVGPMRHFACATGEQWLTEERSMNGDSGERVLYTCVRGKWLDLNKPAKAGVRREKVYDCRNGEQWLTDEQGNGDSSTRVLYTCVNGKWRK
jgi:hypothetical protein